MLNIKRMLTGLIGACLVTPYALAQVDCGDAVIVSAGDTLSDIARRCGTSVSAILDANRLLTDSNQIDAGTILNMPGTTARVYTSEQPAANSVTAILTDAEIDQLVAPVALYPDVLLAELLPASTYPLEVVQAARWRKTNADLAEVDEQDWEPSIKALTRYPDVLNKLNDELEWTIQLGETFLAQPDAVFDSIQRMRARAEAAGTLRTTEQQVVVREQTEVVEVIRIVPANPRYVYVPYYDPYAVYYPYHGARVVHGPAISFSAGFALGGWLNYQLNWGHRHIYHHVYTPVYYGGHQHRVITRYNAGYVPDRHDGRRWRHDYDRARRHHADRGRRYYRDGDARHAVARDRRHRDAQPGVRSRRDSQRDNFVERGDLHRGLRADRDRQVNRRNRDNRNVSAQRASNAINTNEARMIRLQNRRDHDNDSQRIINRIGTRSEQQRRQTDVVRDRNSVRASTMREQQRIDDRQGDPQNHDQRVRNDTRMRRAADRSARANRAVLQSSARRSDQPRTNNQPRINVQPRTNNQPHINVQPRTNNQPRINVQPRTNNQPRINVQRREATPARSSSPRNSHGDRNQSAGSMRVRAERNDRNSEVRARYQNSSRGSSRLREQRR